MIKINLPSPREMTVPEFFAQMKIALKSAEKSYEEMIRGVDLSNGDNEPWISFRINNINDLNGGENDKGWIKIDEFICEDDSQELSLEIDRL